MSSLKEIFIPIWNVKINFFTSVKFSKAIRDFREHYDFDGEMDMDALGYTIDAHGVMGMEIVIILPKRAKLSTIYHEALHATYSVLRKKGVPTTYDNQECMTYLQGYIADQIIDILSKPL